MEALMIPPILGWFWVAVWFIVKAVAVTAITTGISYLLAQKNKSGMKAAGVNEFKYPTAQEGRPLPVVWGKRRVLSCNAISPIFNMTYKKKKRHGQTVAYFYYVSLHVQVCLGADGIVQLWVGGKCVWPTLNHPETEAADATLTADIDAFNCFGGYKREGGVEGIVRIQYGGAAQARNAHLELHLGSGIPAYRGMVGMVWEGLYIGTTPYLKPMTALTKRTDILCDPARTEMWYIAKANVGDDHCNAIHVLYELITSPYIGAGKGAALIGDSFTTAADTCYTEGYGLDIVWDSAGDDVQSMIDKVLEVIDGALYQDMATGKFEVALARYDYTPATLDVYDESDFWVEDYEIPDPAKIPSKTFVMFHDRVSTKPRPAYDDDIALIEIQGRNAVTQTLNFEGLVADEVLANKIASREQQQASAMGKVLVLNCDRRMYDLHKNSVFKISYTALSISEMIVRVLDAEYGSLEDGRVRLTVMEDVFGAVYTVYGTPPVEQDAEGVTDPQTDIRAYGDTTTGVVTWDDGIIQYEGQTYQIAGDTTGTTDQYVYFDPSVSTTELQHSAVAPSGDTAYVVFENNAGVVTQSYAMGDEADVIEQASAISDNWRYFEGADEKLHLQHEDGGTWEDEAEFGDEVA